MERPTCSGIEVSAWGLATAHLCVPSAQQEVFSVSFQDPKEPQVWTARKWKDSATCLKNCQRGITKKSTSKHHKSVHTERQSHIDSSMHIFGEFRDHYGLVAETGPLLSVISGKWTGHCVKTHSIQSIHYRGAVKLRASGVPNEPLEFVWSTSGNMRETRRDICKNGERGEFCKLNSHIFKLGFHQRHGNSHPPQLSSRTELYVFQTPAQPCTLFYITQTHIPCPPVSAGS